MFNLHYFLKITAGVGPNNLSAFFLRRGLMAVIDALSSHISTSSSLPSTRECWRLATIVRIPKSSGSAT